MLYWKNRTTESKSVDVGQTGGTDVKLSPTTNPGLLPVSGTSALVVRSYTFPCLTIVSSMGNGHSILGEKSRKINCIKNVYINVCHQIIQSQWIPVDLESNRLWSQHGQNDIYI